jgi:malic enzyme
MEARSTASAAITSSPRPFDPRLMEVVASAVAEAAIKSGVARKAIEDSIPTGKRYGRG